MTELELIDHIIRNVQAVHTDESRFDEDFVAAEIYTVRGMAIGQWHQKWKRINPLWLQTITLEYNANLQEDVSTTCITKYIFPNYIALDGRMDGVTFIGNSENKSFRRIRTRGELATLLKHSKLSPDKGDYIAVLTENGYVEVIAQNRIKSLTASLILANPNDDPLYNPQVDQFPISVDLIPIMTDILIKLYFARMASMPINIRMNKTDLIPAPAK